MRPETPRLTARGPRRAGSLPARPGFFYQSLAPNHQPLPMAFGKSKLTNPEIAQLKLIEPMSRDDHEARAVLARVSRELKRVANSHVMTWLRWHDERQTLARLRTWSGVADFRGESAKAITAWIIDQRQQARVDCGSQAQARVGFCPTGCPPELAARMRREADALVPSLHYSTMLATSNWLCQTIGSQDSPKSNCKRWLRVLAREEAPWSFEGPQPIRLWDGNCAVVRDERGQPLLRAKLEREFEPGKRRATAQVIELRFRKPGESNSGGQARLAWRMLCQIADGERSLAQSQLFERGGNWYLSLTCEGPAPPEHSARDKTITLCVRPGARDALRLRISGFPAGGLAAEEELDRVAAIRSQLDFRRESWRRANGGAPLNSAMQDNLAAIWKRQTQSVCERLVAQLTRAINGSKIAVGRVEWYDGCHSRAALARAGLSSARDKRELFPFYVLRRVAERALEKMGIEFVGRANRRSIKRRIEDAKKRKAAGAATKTPRERRGGAAKSGRRSRAVT